VLARLDLEAEHAAGDWFELGACPDPFDEPARVGEEGVGLGTRGPDDHFVDHPAVVVDHRRRRAT
jgi:hypothetical protein